MSRLDAIAEQLRRNMRPHDVAHDGDLAHSRARERARWPRQRRRRPRWASRLRGAQAYSAGVIGLFGLAGAVGAWAARLVGPLIDKGRDHATTGLLLFAVVIGWVLMGLNGGRWLIPLLLGIIVLDLGVQGMQVTNLAVNYRIRPEARSRITTAYMITYFGGAVAGSAASGAAYASGGWTAVVGAGLAFAAIALLLWLGEGVLRRRGAAA